MHITTTLLVTVVGYAWGGFVTTQEKSITIKDGVTASEAKALADALKARPYTGEVGGQKVAFGDLQQIFDASIEQTCTTVEVFDLAKGRKTVTTVYDEELVPFADEDSQDTVDRINHPEMYQDEEEEEEA